MIHRLIGNVNLGSAGRGTTQALTTASRRCNVAETAIERRNVLPFRPPSSRSFGSNGDGAKEDATALDDHRFCVDLVRTRDRENYLCGLLQPGGETREAYFAVRAFNAEIASVKDSVSRAGGQAARRRMAFWREALDAVYDDDGVVSSDPPSSSSSSSAWLRQPVVRSLRRGVRSRRLTRRRLERLVDARERDLDDDDDGGLETVDDLLRYADDAGASTVLLGLECCLNDDEDEHDRVSDAAYETAFHVGTGVAIATALRSTIHRVSRGESSPLPLETLARHGVPTTYLSRPEQLNDVHRPGLRAAVAETAAIARYHLSAARRTQGEVPNKGRAALLPAVSALLWLKRLERADHDLFDERLYQSGGGLGESSAVWHPLYLARAWLTGVF